MPQVSIEEFEQYVRMDPKLLMWLRDNGDFWRLLGRTVTERETALGHALGSGPSSHIPSFSRLDLCGAHS